MGTQTSRLTRFGIALVAIWFGLVAYAYLESFSLWLTLNDYRFDPWPRIRGATLYVWTPWLLFVPVVQMLGRRVPIDPRRCVPGVMKHLALMLSVAIAHGYLAALLYYHIGWFESGMEAYRPWQHTGHFLFMDDLFMIDAFIYSCIVASQSINLGYFLAQKSEIDKLRMQAQLTEAKMQALKMQINPHFLFNTLNSISVLAQKGDNVKVEEMIAGLSDFFRRTLEHGEEQLITLRDEIALIDRYLTLEKTRFGDRLEVEYLVDETCLDERVPALLLQPLAENAVKHGLAGGERCRVTLSATRADRGIELEMTDSGRGSSSASSSGTGVGLANVKARLETLYRGLQRFEYSSRPGAGTVVRILIPSEPTGGARA